MLSTEVMESKILIGITFQDIQWDNVHSFIKVDDSVKEVTWAKPGSKAGLLKLEEFSEKHLESFSSDRNDPTKDALSNLSPWFHAGFCAKSFNLNTVLFKRKFFM